MAVVADTPVDEGARALAVEKVRKLINLAASPNLREAERAAYKACALIRDLGLDIADPEEINGVFAALHAAEKRVQQLEVGAARSSTDDVFDGLTRAMYGMGQAARQAAAATASQSASRPASRPVQMTTPVRLVSKFSAQCKFCKKPLSVGDPILWMKAVGTWCQTTDCYQNWVNTTNFKP